MSVLSDVDITNMLNNGLEIEPFNVAQLQPASYDVRLHSRIAILDHKDSDFIVSTKLLPITRLATINAIEGYVLKPGEFILGGIDEIVKLDNTLVARIEGKSSLGRLGLAIHVTAGFVDPGWDGRLTIEIKNHALYSIRIYAGMMIAQLSFHKLLTPSHRMYGQLGLKSKYNRATEVEGSK